MYRRRTLRVGDLPQTRSSEAQIEHFDGQGVRLDLRFGGDPNVPPTTIPAGHVLVLGDSRSNSRNSRHFGFVRVSALYARALRIYSRSGEGLVWLPLAAQRSG